MIKVITYGTFDLFHYGHYNLLKRAADLGDSLYVGVSSDEACIRKGKVPFLTQEKRLEIVSSLKFVEKVFLEENMEQKVLDVEKYGIDIFVLGDDYQNLFPMMKEYQQLMELGCKVIFLPRTPEISTSELKKKVVEQSQLNISPDTIYNKTRG